MSEQKLRVVPFHPEKKRHLELGDLAKQIVKAEKQRSVTDYDKCLDRERNKVMRRLYHIGYGTSTIYSFPIVLEEYTDKKGWKENFSQGRSRIGINVLELYRDLANELRVQGFKAKAKIVKATSEHFKGYHAVVFEVTGVKKK